MRELLVEKFEKPKRTFWFEYGQCEMSVWENKFGQTHRSHDLPAIVSTKGDKYWYKNGIYHRNNDEPAVIRASGSKFWFKEGFLHRDDSMPAVIRSNGEMEWWINGQRIKTNFQCENY